MSEQDSTPSAPILQRLIEGLAPPFDDPSLDPAADALPAAVPFNWLGVAILGAIGLGLLIWAGIRGYRKRAIRALWPALSTTAEPAQDRESAQMELTLLEFLVSLTDEKAQRRAALWNVLTPSERSVALATLRDEPIQDLAQRMACTTSHIYNLRASIRKKWDLDMDLPLRVALSQLLEEEGGADGNSVA